MFAHNGYWLHPAQLSTFFSTRQNDFLNQVDRLIDWRPIRTLINKKYTKRQNAIGAPAYDVILLFKMLLLETWYNLSDCALEERINDSITFSRFLGLKMEEVSPDHSTISRFRSALTELGLMDKLLAQFNKQLSRHHISVREGVLVDASLVEIRSTIERTFGSIRRWFHGGRCRYRGLAKTHTRNILESIAFNLYRTPGIIMSSSLG